MVVLLRSVTMVRQSGLRKKRAPLRLVPPPEYGGATGGGGGSGGAGGGGVIGPTGVAVALTLPNDAPSGYLPDCDDAVLGTLHVRGFP